jgi:hypothetical protein
MPTSAGRPDCSCGMAGTPRARPVGRRRGRARCAGILDTASRTALRDALSTDRTYKLHVQCTAVPTDAYEFAYVYIAGRILKIRSARSSYLPNHKNIYTSCTGLLI